MKCDGNECMNLERNCKPGETLGRDTFCPLCRDGGGVVRDIERGCWGWGQGGQGQGQEMGKGSFSFTLSSEWASRRSRETMLPLRLAPCAT